METDCHHPLVWCVGVNGEQRPLCNWEKPHGGPELNFVVLFFCCFCFLQETANLGANTLCWLRLRLEACAGSRPLWDAHVVSELHHRGSYEMRNFVRLQILGLLGGNTEE